MSEKEIEIWGKPLEKMTVKDLREVAKDVPGINGVHAMKKDELVSALRDSQDIKEVKVTKKDASVAEIKKKINQLKSVRQAAIESKDKKTATIYKRRISRLKKKTRRAAV